MKTQQPLLGTIVVYHRLYRLTASLSGSMMHSGVYGSGGHCFYVYRRLYRLTNSLSGSMDLGSIAFMSINTGIPYMGL